MTTTTTTTTPAQIRSKNTPQNSRFTLIGIMNFLSYGAFAYIYAIPFYVGFTVIRDYVAQHGYSTQQAFFYALFIESLVLAFGVVALRNTLLGENVWGARIASFAGMVISVIINTAGSADLAERWLHFLPPFAAYVVLEFAMHQIHNQIKRKQTTSNAAARQQALQTSLESAESERDELQTQVEQLQAEKGAFQTRLETVKSERDNLQTQVEDFQTNENSVASVRSGLQTQVEELQASLKSVSTQRDTLQTQVENLKVQPDQFATDDAELESIKTELQTAKAELESSQKKLQKKAAQLKAAQADLQHWKNLPASAKVMITRVVPGELSQKEFGKQYGYTPSVVSSARKVLLNGSVNSE